MIATNFRSAASNTHTILGIVIPAHNEKDHLAVCLSAIEQAIVHVKALVLSGLEVRVLVVLDNCSDDSLAITQQFDVDYMQCNFQCVGQARDLGVRYLIEQGADWIACTDADSRVHVDWLTQQLNHQPAHAICGVVEVDNWQHLSASTQHSYIAHYQDQMNHQHIHGANLSFSAAAYLQVGGFAAVTCHEDVSLVNRMRDQQLNIIWSNQVRVTTSSRLTARAPEGFAAFLNELESGTTATASKI